MKVEFNQPLPRLGQMVGLARKAESVGCDGISVGEGNRDPFLRLLAAAMHTTRLSLGTAVAIAFGRSPLVTAHTAWELQDVSRGRLLLGLGSQVKGHIERRYGMPWESPGPRLREYILAMRAIWDCWQNGTELSFQGKYYTHTLMPMAWRPLPIEHPHIPVYVSAVNPYMCGLAGELCEGIRLHPISSPSYTREVVLPAMTAAAHRAGRSPADIDVVCVPPVATGADEAEVMQNIGQVRRTIARFAATRTYHRVFEHHGYAELVPKLHALSLQEKWDDMASLIDDDIVYALAIVATYDQMANRIKERWGGLATRIVLWPPQGLFDDDERLRSMVAAVSGITAN